MSVVKWEMKSRWLNWRGEFVHLLVEGEGERLVVRQDGEMSGLQHVPEVLHCFVARGHRHCCAGLSFLEKKASSCQASCTRCCRTAPMAVVEASVTRASGADGSRWARRAAGDRLALHSRSRKSR